MNIRDILKDIKNKGKSMGLRFKGFNPYKKGIIIAFFILFIVYLFALPHPLFDEPYSTLVSDRNGELLGARISGDGQWRFPSSDNIPDKYKTCLIQFEDRYFRYHPGVDFMAMARAMYKNIKAGKITSGGSTITMQTVRLMRKNKRTYIEKMLEMILATRLELSYSKNSIIALYASHAPMGGNVVGIEAASWRYFGHASATLSWAEAATLAVLPNAPSMMHFGKDRAGLQQKRNRLLKKLYTKKYINETDYKLALSEPLPAQPHELPQYAPHLVSQMFLKNPACHTLSTIDKHLQIQAEEVLERWNNEFSQNGIFNMAALIVDIEKNEVLSYIGNVNFNSKLSSNQVDVIQSPRSTGSILKPFLYCAMLQEGSMLPNELLPDIPVNIGGFSPKNFSLQYEGAVPAGEALARSLNIPFVVSLRKYGVPKFYQFLKNMGMGTLNKSAENYGLSLILGGAEGTLWDIANGYAEMAKTVNYYNKNKNYIEKIPFSIQKNSNSFKVQRTTSPLFNAGAAWLTLEVLTNVNRPEEIDWHFIPSIRKIAWKTGTSFGFRDGWAIGVTPRFLVGVWTGNASGEGRPGLTGARTSARAMFDLFNLLPPTAWFDKPYGELTEVEICKESGCLKGINCPPSSIEKAFIPKKIQHNNICNYHKLIHISTDYKYRVYEQCAGNRGIMPIAWFVLPPSWEWYYKKHHPSYMALPPLSPECMNGTAGQIMQFIYPYPHSIIKVTKQLDGTMGKVIFELAHRNPTMKVFWHLDNNYIGETTDIHQMQATPAKGEHTLTVVDEAGNTNAIHFRIE